MGCLSYALQPNPGTCPDWPDWALNLRRFALQDDAQLTEPHQSGQKYVLNEMSLNRNMHTVRSCIDGLRKM